MSAATKQANDLQTALSHTSKLLESKPELALIQAQEILRVVPGQANALMLLAASQTKLGNLQQAIDTLIVLCKKHTAWPAAHYELGLLFVRVGLGDKALAAFKNCLKLKQDLPKVWLALADLYSAMGDEKSAEISYAQQLKYSSNNADLMSAAEDLIANRLPEAERALKKYLHDYPTDVAAIRMLAEVAARLGRDVDAENLLARCLELAPNFNFARQNYSYILNRNNKFELVLEQAELLLKTDSNNLSYKNLKAVALSKMGDYENAIKLYDEVLIQNPGYSRIWHSFGHTLKTAGLLSRAIEVYRKSTELEPHYGEAYWSLANLKTFRFTDNDIAEMQAQLNNSKLNDEDRFHFNFALAKALEDQKKYKDSFINYEKGNTLRKSLINYSQQRNSRKLATSKQILTKEFFQQRNDFGVSSAEPIFILGMPRAGSTLLEQILSSHSQVEGTMELPEIIAITKDLYRRQTDIKAKTYYSMLPDMSNDQAEVYGRRYLENTQVHRKSGKPLFIDKMPNNFAHIGLIQMILPNAKIIDARRHPMACCFSNFKQHFARGQSFSYGLQDMGHYYRDYVELMAHFDDVLPGRIHRVHYENIVENTEFEVRRLLEYCDLPFEEGCMRFFENDRPVRTASSEQVRQPIYKDGVEHWRHFEEWLEPLKQSLGSVLDVYPDVPKF
jgi:tetratricopeptide (TPR) repeat protein